MGGGGIRRGELTTVAGVALTAIIPDKFNILSDKQLADITLNPQKYNRSVIYLGKMLLRGEILPGQ